MDDCSAVLGKMKHVAKQHMKFVNRALERRMLFVGCLTSQQLASVSQGRICSDSFTGCHTEIEVADQTFYLTQSQYTETRPTSPNADQTPGRVATRVPVLKSLVWLDLEKSHRKRDSNPGSSTLEADALTARPTRRSERRKTWGVVCLNSIVRRSVRNGNISILSPQQQKIP